MKHLVWAPSAFADLKHAFEYIALDSPSRAYEWKSHILTSIEKLSRFPARGRIIPEIGESRYRELIVGEYRVFHEVREKEILIFHILHSKQFFQ